MKRIIFMAIWIALIMAHPAMAGNDKANAITIYEAPPFEEVYVPDSDDDCPVSDKVPLAAEYQEYIWTKCKRTTPDYKNYYCFILATIEKESSFKFKAYGKNGDGSVDRGIMQINSSNIAKMKRAGFIQSAEDLYNPYKCIDCGMYMMDYYIDKFGVCETTYYAYNTGKEKAGSTKTSREVMQYMSNWKKILFPEEQ